MPSTTPGAVLRQLQNAQAGMRKARQAMQTLRADIADTGEAPNPRRLETVMNAGWRSLTEAHRILAAIPLDAATEPVMTRQLAVQRYATALLVRLRRLAKQEGPDADEYDLDEEDE